MSVYGESITNRGKMKSLAAYIPIDRRRAIASGADLPNRILASVLMADISGFTPLNDTLVRELGPKRAADELTR